MSPGFKSFTVLISRHDVLVKLRMLRIDFADADGQQSVEPHVGRILALGHQHRREILGIDADERQQVAREACPA